ncbi:hypothetical protein K3495_g3991 [Podosphaera aphanis]|nr:hypothetical protein K3495_g3991 [Podosphaera aphanis]
MERYPQNGAQNSPRQRPVARKNSHPPRCGETASESSSTRLHEFLLEAINSDEIRIPPEYGVRSTASPVSGNENARIHGLDNPDLARRKPGSLYKKIYEKKVLRSISPTPEASPQLAHNGNNPFWRSSKSKNENSLNLETLGPALSQIAAIQNLENELSQSSNPPSEAGKGTPTMTRDKNRLEHTESPYPNTGKSMSRMKIKSSPKQDVFGGKLPAKTLTSCENTDHVQESPQPSTTELKSSQFRLSREKIEESSARISPFVSPYLNQKGIYDETPKSKPNALTNPTPRVTGAYIETPLPLPPSTKSDNFIFQERSKIESENKAAKASIIDIPNRVTPLEQVNRIKEEEGIEDDTDFYQFLEGTENSTASLSLHFQAMHENLIKTVRRLHNVDQSLERLKHPMCDSAMPRANEDDAECNDKITKRTPRFLVTVTPSRPEEPIRIFRNRNWKFTWLGLILFVVGLWSSAEIAMCTVFCHPKYASKNTWHPSDPFFPWAIPTKLDQWTGQVGSGTLDQILDWIDPHRHKKGRRPQHLYSGYDWWGGKDGPASTSFLPAAAATGETGSIDDDELWI